MWFIITYTRHSPIDTLYKNYNNFYIFITNKYTQ